jgi:hypothetical protein
VRGTNQRQVCVQCTNDASVADIEFDGAGVCSLCRAFEAWRERLSDRERLSAIWRERVLERRGRGNYDAICGLSGGKDSAYVLYQLVREHGLRVRALTFDNGFLTDWARANIARVVEDLGVDHAVVKLPPPALSMLCMASLKAVGGICTACAFSTFTSLLSGAVKNDIPLVIHGRSPAQTLRYFSPTSRDPFVPFLHAGLRPSHEVDAVATYESVIERLKQNLPPSAMALFAQFFPKYRDTPPDFLAYFLYHPYDEAAILGYLKSETSWQAPPEFQALAHYDCAACDASNYLFERAEGRPHNMPEVGAAVRIGKMSRKRALELLDEERFTSAPVESLNALGKFLQRTPEQLVELAESSVTAQSLEKADS